MPVRFVGVVLLLLAGCDSGPRIYRVSGAVNYQGKPAPRAELRFAPDYIKGNDGPAGAAFAVDGKFDTSGAGGRGVIGGPYKVTIFVFDGKPSPEQPHGRVLAQHEEERVFAASDAEVVFDVPAKK